MILLQREYELIASLNPSEKRFVKLIGKAVAGSSGSQQLLLFDVLNRMKKYDQRECEKHRKLIAMQETLPTLARRLRRLILKCLQQLENKRSLSGRLGLLLHEAEFSFQRQQTEAALRAARAGQKLASLYGRYEASLPFIDWQRRILLDTFPADAMQQLDELHELSQETLSKLERQQWLRRFQVVLSGERRLGTTLRSAKFEMTLQNIAQHASLRKTTAYPDLLTESLAKDVKGLLLLATRKGEEALEVYSTLLKRWQHEPEWIREFHDFYLALFKNYQLAIFWGTLSNKRMQSYLDLLPGIKELPPKSRLDFQRIRHGHLVTLGLNTGKFELVFSQVPVLLAWMKENRESLPLNSQLAFQYNICITYFLGGLYREAYRHLQPILRHKERGDREDILDFSRVLQSILLCQLGDDNLGEYLLRSARQFFKRNPRQWAFEEAVLRYLGLSITTKNKRQLEQLGTELMAKLENFERESSRPYPLLGLVEVQCWLQSRRSGKKIREVFMEKLVRSEE
jgi:hypothetical protein